VDLQPGLSFATLALAVRMNYHLHDGYRELGVFPLEDLRRRRQAGALTGEEFAWSPGMTDWLPLDEVLRRDASVAAAPPALSPPPLSGEKPGRNTVLVVLALVASVGFVLVMTATGIFAARFALHSHNATSSEREEDSGESAVDLASKPVVWNTNTLTWVDTQNQNREFCLRQFLDGYEKRGERSPACDAPAIQLIQAWVAEDYGPPRATNLPTAMQLADELETNSACVDPAVLVVAGVNSIELHEAIRRMERAEKGFENSKHRAFPKFFTTVMLASKLDYNSPEIAGLDASALKDLKDSLADGSLLPKDQSIMAEALVLGWGKSFFARNGAAVSSIARNSGKSFQWLALVLEGEYQINEAWRVRGDGYADSVTREGWNGFHEHLAEARKSFTKAWQLSPDLPLAPDRMMTVSLGDSDLAEIRLWFDRTVAVQVDFPDAWAEMRWGLRPRWYGSTDAMLAFGVAALNTGRFDTDVPRKLFDVVQDMEEEIPTPAGDNIYCHDDIWPNLQQMYEGYIAEPSKGSSRDEWRSDYAAVAFLAGKYDVARTQLEALDWQPHPAELKGWHVDLSLMPLEVAARTGSCGDQVVTAESHRIGGELSQALKIYTNLLTAANADARTKAFARCRAASVDMEQRLNYGVWVDFLPQSDDDPNWAFVWGKPRCLSDGALEVESGEEGHLLYSRAHVGENFEVKGEFEVVRSSSKNFQAGLVMGMPDCDTRFNTIEWYGFRMKQSPFEGQIASLSIGWTKNQITMPVALDSKTNAFYFRLQHNRVTASVNGREIFHDASLPRVIGVNSGDFLLGLGAFNNSDETVIRYRNVQIHKLSSSSWGADGSQPFNLLSH
jgi:hypothetical protein